jgi:hypothetical protein
MITFKLIACSGAALLFLACAFKIVSAETLTFHLSAKNGIELKAETSRPTQAKD